MMRRGLLVTAMIGCLLLCGVLVWAAQAVAIQPFVLPSATDLVVTRQTDGALRIVYRAGGAPFAWRGELGKRLKAAGWTGRSYTNMGARRPPFVTIWYAREMWVGPVSLEERAIFGNHPDDPDAASIAVYRELRWSN